MSYLPLVDKPLLGPLTPITDGGQGVIYSLASPIQSSAGKGVHLVYKEYKADARGHLDISALDALAKFRDSLPVQDRTRLISRAAFPIHLVRDGAGVAGFTMVRVPDQFYQTMNFSRGPAKVLTEVQHLLQPGQVLTRRGIVLDERARLQFLLDVTETLHFFHLHRIVVGDFSAKNLLFNLQAAVKSFFLDCDSMVFNGKCALPLVETPCWEIPGGETPGTRAGDLYKLGLLAVRLFAGDEMLRDPKQAPSLGAPLRSLARDGLASNPGSRPSADAWIKPIRKMLTSASAASQHQTPLAQAASPSWRPPPTPLPKAPHVAPTAPPVRSIPHVAPGRRTHGGLVAFVATAALGVGIFFAVHHGMQVTPQGPASSSTSQVNGVENVLDQSGASRARLGRAISDVESCSDPHRGLELIRKVVSQRTDQLKLLADFSFPPMPNGQLMRSDLLQALRYSRAADRDYASWAAHVARTGCRAANTKDRYFRAGTRASVEATRYKRRFLALFNPVAEGDGFSALGEYQI